MRRGGDGTRVDISCERAGGHGELPVKEGLKEGISVRNAVLKTVGAEKAVVFEEGAVTEGRRRG